MAVELLERALAPLDGRRGELVAAVKGDVGRLEDVAQRLLEVSRSRAMTIALERQHVDLRDVVARVAQVFALQAAERGVSLETMGPRDELAITGDATKLTWALSNLVTNALRYTPRGGRVTVETVADDGTVRVVVSDNGPGIPADQRERVFERYVQGQDRPAGAAGLGLAIVRGIVQAHGGHGWPRVAAGDPPAAPRERGDPDDGVCDRPRCGRGDAERRVRLPREAVLPRAGPPRPRPPARGPDTAAREPRAARGRRRAATLRVPQSGDAAGARDGPPRGRIGRDDPGDRRERRRQERHGGGYPSLESPVPPSVRYDHLYDARRASPRERALRARPGCLPGRLAGQAGTPGSRRGRHGVPRRGRRVASRASREAAPLPRGAPIRAGRRQRDDHREYADHRRNQPRPRGRGPRGALS